MHARTHTLPHPLDEQGVLGDALHGFEQEAAEGKSPDAGLGGHQVLLKLPEGRVHGLGLEQSAGRELAAAPADVRLQARHLVDQHVPDGAHHRPRCPQAHHQGTERGGEGTTAIYC